jgi:hypothetical protein
MGSSTADLLFPLFFPPTLITVTPNSGSSDGGTVVDLAGMHFRPGATVTFGGVPATGIVFVSSSHITCTTAAHASGAVNVTVTNPDAQASTLVNGFTYQGLFVAISDGTVAATSPNGATWTQRVIPNILAKGIAFGAGIYVAVGNDAATSPDGINWTQRVITGTPALDSIAYGNGIFVATSKGGGSTCQTSPDGITWTSRALGAFGFYTVTFGGGTFVIVGPSSRTSLTSPDGITWTPHANALPQTCAWQALTFGNGTFVAACGNSTVAATSPDGIAWTQRALPSAVAWAGLAHGNGIFVGVASNTTIAASSPTGSVWTQRAMPASATWLRVTFGNGTFVAIVLSSSIAATSPDGITWTQRAMPIAANWRDVVCAS